MNENKQMNELSLKVTCILASILKGWKIVLLIMMFCGVFFDMSKTLTYKPIYQTSLKASLKNEENSFSQLKETASFIKTLDVILNGQVVENYVKDAMNIEDVSFQVTATSIAETNLMNLKVTANSRQEAFYTLNYLVEWYQENKEQYHFNYELDVLEKNPINTQPVNTNSHIQNLKQGLIFSGLVVIVLMMIVEYAKDSIKTPNDIQNNIDARLFAKIPKENKARGKKFWSKSKKAILITSLKTSFMYKESIKKLRNRVEESAKKHKYKSIMITSSLENEGKSSIAANLAIALSQNNHRVLLVDADLRKPSIHKIFQVKTKKSINLYLMGKDDWINQTVSLENNKNLHLLCAKPDVKNSELLVSSENMKFLLEGAKFEYDFIIVDSSPTYQMNESILLNENVDATLVVIKQNEASTKIINKVIADLVNMKNNVIGCIYNSSVHDIMKSQRAYGYRYGYRYNRNGREG